MNAKRQQDEKLTILYERLSQDDGEGESNSITNQKRILEEYAQREGLRNIRHIVDDGWSGTRFDRPGFTQMMDEAAAGNVGAVVCKDLSRFGRDHLRVGLYTESLRERGVRFVAVQDNVDTASGEENDFTPFRNIINEWAARDSSRKVKAVLKSKGMSGKRLSSVPVYGYAFDGGDKSKWVIDPEAAAVVRRIFQMTVGGMGPQQIAKALSAERIERPSYYMNRRGIARYSRPTGDPRIWASSTVRQIIARPEYMGHTVNFKFRKDSYKDRRPKSVPPSEWVIFPNTHEAVVEPETWETAQRLRKTVKRTDTTGEANPLTGKVFCADCGARMYNHRKLHATPRYTNSNTGKVYMYSPSDVFSCSTHSKAIDRFGGQACSMHHIRTAVLRELALDAIRAAGACVRGGEEEFAQRVREASALQHGEAAKSYRKRIAKNDRLIAELDMLFRKTYEDNATGKLSDERFEQLSSAYESEQADLKRQNAALQAEVDAFDADSARADNFIGLVKKYTDFAELTTPMINEFVDKILVYEGDRSSGRRTQRVDIYLNFIGIFPRQEMECNRADTDAGEGRKSDAVCVKRSGYNRRYYAKLMAKNKEGIGATPGQ